MSDNLNTMTDEHPTPQCKPSQKEQDLLQDLKTDGRKELEEKFPKGINIPATSILEVFHFDIKVSQVFTLPCLVDGRNQRKSIKYEEILQHFLPKDDQQQHLQKHDEQEDSRETAQRRVILIEGVPGFGKTTLSRKIFFDWMSGNSSIKRLHDYDFVILVDSKDDPSLSSLDELLSSHMPTSVENFKKEHPDSTGLRHLRILVIVDSLEELSERFASQLQEIINDEISKNLDFIVLTRPEKVKSFSEMVPTKEFVHMKIEGLHTSEEREGFIKKYVEELRRKELLFDAEGIQFLLKSTESHLSFLWSNPLCLVLVTLLWAFDPDKVNPNTTPINIFLEVWKSYITRLKKRLMVNDTINKFDRRDVTLGRNIKKFLFILSKMAFQSLRDNNVQLTKASHETLQQTCQFLNLPENEVIGVFLLLRKDFSVDFIEKSQRDILAALYLYHGMVGGETGANERTVQDLIKTLKQYESSDSITQEIRDIINSFCPLQELLLPECAIRHNTQPKPEATKTFQSIKKILQEMDEKVSKYLSKYQEVLIHLLGFVHDLSPDSIKQLVELIKESGAEDDIPKWMEVITRVKYDDTVASKIAEEANIESYMITILDNGHNCDFLLAKFKHKSSESYQEMILDDENIRGLFALLKQKRPLCADICIEKETGKVAMLESLVPWMIDVKMSVNSLYLKDESETLRRVGDPNTPNPNIKKVLQRMTPQGRKKLFQLLDLDETFVQDLHASQQMEVLSGRDVDPVKEKLDVGERGHSQTESKPINVFLQDGGNLNFFKVLKCLKCEGSPALLSAFEWVSKKDPDQSFKDFFMVERKMSKRKYKRYFNSAQRDLMESDLSGKSFDVTLLFLIMRFGCAGLSQNWDDWREGNDSSIESNCTKLKNLRNYALQENEKVFADDAKMIDYIEEIQKCLEQILRLSAEFSPKGKLEVDDKVQKMKENVQNIKELSFPSKELLGAQVSISFNYLKVLKCLTSKCPLTLLTAFEWISEKDPAQSFKDFFLVERQMPNGLYKKCFNKHQMNKMESDPSGKSFDVTLLFVIIRWGCAGLSHNRDDWKEGNDISLESNVTMLKKMSYIFLHSANLFIDNAEMINYIEKIQKYLEQILRLSAHMAGIGIAKVDEKVKEMKESLQEIKVSKLSRYETAQHIYNLKAMEGSEADSGESSF